MSSVASHPVGGFPRFAARFSRTAGLLAVLGLVAALALTVLPSWSGFGGDDEPAYQDLSAAKPVQLSISGLGLTAPLVATDREPIETLNAPPDDAPLVTWWSDSAQPGAPRGQTVLMARADGRIGGLTAISGLEEEQFLDVVTDEGTMRYEITGVHTLGPQRMRKASLGFFKQDGGGGRLVAVSAEGWDGVQYARAVVVTAVPLGEPLD